LSHQILQHMHKVLNINKNNNYLGLFVIYKTNLLSLINPWLDNICQI
jgi:hypothetical protein